MSEFHEGRVAATFSLGARIEDTKDAYEKEIVGLDGMKAALVMSVKNLMEYNQQISQDIASNRMPVREGDVALKYVANCIDLLQKMATDTEAKRFAAVGAIEALKRIVADVKTVWEQEQAKLKEIQEFESQENPDMRQRPVGYVPKEKPIDAYKKETDQLEIAAQFTKAAQSAPAIATTLEKVKKGRKSRA